MMKTWMVIETEEDIGMPGLADRKFPFLAVATQLGAIEGILKGTRQHDLTYFVRCVALSQNPSEVWLPPRSIRETLSAIRTITKPRESATKGMEPILDDLQRECDVALTILDHCEALGVGVQLHLELADEEGYPRNLEDWWFEQVEPAVEELADSLDLPTEDG